MLQENLPGNKEKLAARKLVNMCAWIIKGTAGESEICIFIIQCSTPPPHSPTLPTESMLKIKTFNSLILYF